MGRMRAIVVGLFLLAGCAKTKAKLFCEVAVENGPYPHQYDRCMREYLEAGADERSCYERCAGKTDRSDFGDCMNKCRGLLPSPPHAWPPVSKLDAGADAR